MARAVRLFFQNGGTQCYVMRISDDTAAKSEVTLRNESQQPVLRVVAKSPGLIGDYIRIVVNYKGLYPESTFNMEVFRWSKNNNGQLVKTDIENWQSLSMDPNNPRYVETYVNQNSKLVELEDLGVPPAASGYSQTGRPVPSRTATIFRNKWLSLVGTASADPLTNLPTNRFRISVDGGVSFVDVNLSGIDFGIAPLNNVNNIQTNLEDAIETVINNSLPSGLNIYSNHEAGPVGPNGADHQDTVMLRIASVNGDVRIQPATTEDLTRRLMLGTAQGGIEISRYSQTRPAPTGVVFDIDNLVELSEQKNTAFRTFTIDTTSIDLSNTLETGGAGKLIYQDNFSPSANENCDGIREKWAIIASAINAQKDSNPTFKWSAEVWGSRLAVIPGDGGDNSQTNIITSGGDDVDIGPGDLDHFIQNVRYYNLGTSGQGNFQINGKAGADGNAPALKNYSNAFEILDKEVDLFNLMVLPSDSDHNPATSASLWGPASIFCQQKRAFLLMDPLEAWQTVQEATNPATGVNSLRIGLVKDHCAIFYPRITISENGLIVNIGASGAIAGLISRIDGSRGVWKAPAGTEADLRGIVGVQYNFSDRENGILNPQGINTIRVFPNGVVNWGARTMDGDDDFASEYKYIPVRRTALYIRRPPRCGGLRPSRWRSSDPGSRRNSVTIRPPRARRRRGGCGSRSTSSMP